jgi:methionyl-tRNA synthetase
MYDVGGRRMSKTTGNTEDPEEMADRFGVDGVRYAVLREVPFDRDSNVTLDGFVRRYNADLANDLGNLVNRTVSMSGRYLDGLLPPVTDADQPADREIAAVAERAVADYRAAMDRHQLDEALAAMMTVVGAANGYAESQAPWVLNKAGEHERVGAVLAVLAEACRIVGHLLAPVAPTAARRIHEQLGVPPPYDERGAGGPGLGVLAAWGGGPAGWQTTAASPIFPRVELEPVA